MHCRQVDLSAEALRGNASAARRHLFSAAQSAWVKLGYVPPTARPLDRRAQLLPPHTPDCALVRNLHLRPERVQPRRYSGHRAHVARSPVHHRKHSALGPLTEHMHADRRVQALQRRQLRLAIVDVVTLTSLAPLSQHALHFHLRWAS